MPLPQAFIDLVNSPAVAAELTERDFNAMADVLNLKTERGPVPIKAISGYCSKGITGGVQAMLDIPLNGTIVPASGGNPAVLMTLQIRGALHTVLNLVQIDFRLDTCDVDDPAFVQVCGMLEQFGIVTADDVIALTALAEGQQSKAEKILDRPCTGTDCLEAAGGA